MFLLPDNIDITRYRLRHPSMPAELSGKKLLHLSDLHSRVFPSDSLYNAVAAERPDVIVMTGDMFHDELATLGGIMPLMKRAAALCPCFFIFGNHEQRLPQAVCKELSEKLSGFGIRVLNNDSAELFGAKFYGFVPPVEYITHAPHPTKPLTARGISQEIGRRCAEDFTILLAHDPSRFTSYCKWGADLVFSGHVHGGAVRLPVIGGVFTPQRTFFPKYQCGIYTLGHTAMIVSRGLGRIRIANPPEIITVTMAAR